MPKAKESDVLDHKCLVYWHKKGACSIPVRRVDNEVQRVNLLPGYNTVDFSAISFIAEQCKDVISQKYLTFYGMDISFDDDGHAIVKETVTLDRLSGTELRKIVNETVNPVTLDDLNNPDVVGVKNQDIAEKRKEKLKEATGLEPETIDVRD
jgi:hypothetical protein